MSVCNLLPDDNVSSAIVYDDLNSRTRKMIEAYLVVVEKQATRTCYIIKTIKTIIQ